MKAKFTLLVVFVAAFFAANAQQPTNGGFETWTSSYTPTGWTTYDALIPPLAGSGLSMKDSVDKFAGTSSIKLSNVYVALAQDTIAGAVSIGTGFFDGQQPKLYGTPFTFSPDTLQFAYKYAPVGSDSAGFQIQLHKQGGGVNGYKLAVGGQLVNTMGNWGVITIPLRAYYSDTTGTADTLKLVYYSSYLSGNATSRVGSVMNVDAVRFGYKSNPTFIEEINNNLSVRVFPTPASELVNIQVSEVVKNASIAVFDMNGRIITHEFGDGQNFELVTSNWESGMYTYCILSGGAVVNKGRITVQH
jgi:hypothetical protein